MARDNTPSQLDQLASVLKDRDVEHEIENSPKARRVKLQSRLTYSVPGSTLAFPLVGPTEFVFNADGSVRSVTMTLKPSE